MPPITPTDSSNSTSVKPDILRQLKKLAWDRGFDHCAIVPLSIPERHQAAYLAWCESGSAGQMAYMTRDPQKRISPETAFPEAKSVLTLGVSYFQGPFPEKPGAGYGRVARYAWGEDYHDLILARLETLLADVNELLGKSGHAFLAVDTKPLLERALAEQGGIGFVGKNTMLIAPRSSSLQFHMGSWIFLAEILLDVALPQKDLSPSPSGEGIGVGLNRSNCGDCTKCLTSCPTDAFDGPYRLKANKCISYLTIENKGEIPTDMRSKIGDWLFGCDVCQEVCPFNARAFETRWPELKADRGVGAWIRLEELFEIKTDAEFKQRFGHTPLSRPKRRGLLRNACIVAGNSGDRQILPSLKNLLNDAEPLVRDHATWAITQLQ